MQQIQVTTTITVKEDGEIRAETTQTSGTSNNQNNESNAGAAAGVDTDLTDMTEDEAERYAVASDLANVCDYLDDSEVIKIRLIIQKAEARKEREERT